MPLLMLVSLVLRIRRAAQTQRPKRRPNAKNGTLRAIANAGRRGARATNTKQNEAGQHMSLGSQTLGSRGQWKC
eukprot:11227728-Lingulodinium_polyedra.AAC.1